MSLYQPEKSALEKRVEVPIEDNARLIGAVVGTYHKIAEHSLPQGQRLEFERVRVGKTALMSGDLLLDDGNLSGFLLMRDRLPRLSSQLSKDPQSALWDSPLSEAFGTTNEDVADALFCLNSKSFPARNVKDLVDDTTCFNLIYTGINSLRMSGKKITRLFATEQPTIDTIDNVGMQHYSRRIELSQSIGRETVYDLTVSSPFKLGRDNSVAMEYRFTVTNPDRRTERAKKSVRYEGRPLFIGHLATVAAARLSGKDYVATLLESLDELQSNYDYVSNRDHA